MLCKLSIKNIKKSFKDYAIYFFTLVLGVAIFYVFNAIESQSAMMKITSSTREIIKLMTNMLSGVSVFVSIILGFLIIYASRFLIKRRNKEFGIYLTLGMSKRKISMILFLETLLIGIISLAVGLGLGIILSQFMSILVANMFEADLTEFAFTFSSSSCIKTLIYFGIMYLLVMIFNTINVNRCKLIDLLHASKKSEKVKLKNPLICTIVFIISCLVLVRAYYLVTVDVSSLTNAEDIFKPIIMGVVSTFFIFWSLSGLLLKIVMSLKKVYYKGLNSFVIRQVSSKINTTVMSMTVICLMLFITICVLSSALSIKNSMTANLKTLTPVDIQLIKQMNLTEEKVTRTWRFNSNMIIDSKLTLRETLNKVSFDIDRYLTDVVELDVYGTSDVQIKDTLGTTYEGLKKKYPYLDYDASESFIRVSDYNHLATLFGLPSLELARDEYIVIADYREFFDIRNGALEKDTPIHLLGKDYYPKYDECQNGFIYITSTHSNTGIFIVPDDAVDSSMLEESILVANYKGEDDEKEAIESKISEIESHPYMPNTSLDIKTKASLYQSSVGLGAMATFIGLYLGIIFLLASAAILALKELSESADNKERFRMLRKLGTDDKLIKRALLKQIAIFFMFPMMLALIHSIFGIIFCDFILSTFGNEQLLPSIVMTAIFIVVIYGGYFLITYLCSKNIIKERY